MEFTTVAEGLRFPEGPIAMPDGSVLVVEIERGTLSRVNPDGTVDVVAHCGGGPNGAALGPDGRVWITNNGGSFEFLEIGDALIPGDVPDTHRGGSIQAVDLATGEVETVYTQCEGRPLRSPNDLVMDGHGGFWFTDYGLRYDRTADRTGVFYAQCDGSGLLEVVHPLDSPNGVGLSPSGDRLYVAETYTGRVWAWEIPQPGTVVGHGLLPPHGDLLAGLAGLQLLDSLAVDVAGNVCVATLVAGGITVISPDGSSVEFIPTGDPVTTNICFGGDDLRTAFVTASSSGRLLSASWPGPGLALHHAGP